MDWKIEEAAAWYKGRGAPADQSALTALLREVQREQGGSIPVSVLPVLGELLGVRESYLTAVIRRIPSLRLGDTHCLEVCAGPSCARTAALAKAAEGLASEKVTVKFVPCMRQCGKGPNIRFDGKLYHKAEEKLLLELIKRA